MLGEGGLGISDRVLGVLLVLGVPFDEPVAKTLTVEFLFWLRKPKHAAEELRDILYLNT